VTPVGDSENSEQRAGTGRRDRPSTDVSVFERSRDEYRRALYKDYELAREDDRIWFPFVGTVVALLVTAVGASALSRSSGFDCISHSKSCTTGQQLVLAGLPIVPLAGIAMVALLGMFSTTRQRYMRDLEHEIRKQLQIENTGGRIASGNDHLYLMSWVTLSGEINTTRQGQALYRLIVTGLFLGLIAIYAGVTTIIGIHVDSVERALMTAIYSFSGLLLMGVAIKLALGPHVLYEEIAESHDMRWGERAQPPEKQLLYKKLLIPRQLLVARFLALLSLTVFLSVVALRRFPDWQAGAVIAANCVVFEIGIYSARDQWESLRTGELRQDDPARHKLNVLTTLTVIGYRLGLSALLVGILASWRAQWVGYAIALVFGLSLLQGLLPDARETVLRPSRSIRWLAWALAVVVSAVATFTVRGLVAWRIARFVGPGPGWWLASVIVLTVLAGAAFWLIEPSDPYKRAAEQLRTRIRQIGHAVRSLLLGRSAEAWAKRAKA
jgi:hypothetical protein